MFAVAAWALFKRFWWVIPILLALWWTYHTIYARGAASRDVEVSDLTNQRDAYKHAVDDLTVRVKLQTDMFTKGVEHLKQENAGIVADLGKKLDTANAKAKNTRKKEVTEYVTPKADDACIVPRGFVRLHNESVDPDAAAKTTAVPGGGPKDADAPSGVALSTVAGVVRDNNVEANDRGEVITAWQTWYQRAKAAYDQAAAIINSQPAIVAPSR